MKQKKDCFSLRFKTKKSESVSPDRKGHKPFFFFLSSVYNFKLQTEECLSSSLAGRSGCLDRVCTLFCFKSTFVFSFKYLTLFTELWTCETALAHKAENTRALATLYENKKWPCSCSLSSQKVVWHCCTSKTSERVEQGLNPVLWVTL